MLPLEHSAILLTCIKAIIGLENQFLVFFLSGRLRQVLLYCFNFSFLFQKLQEIVDKVMNDNGVGREDPIFSSCSTRLFKVTKLFVMVSHRGLDLADKSRVTGWILISYSRLPLFVMVSHRGLDLADISRVTGWILISYSRLPNSLSW